MNRIRRNFNLLEWAIYLAEREATLWRRAAEKESAEESSEILPIDSTLEILITRLDSPDKRVRWEVAKRLGEIGDPQAGEALVRLLLDEDHSVRWAAMGSLINLQREAIRPLLEALTHDFQSARLREGAHHVLRTLHDHGDLTSVEMDVFHALEGTAPGIQAAWAANNALIGYQASPGD